MLTSALGEDKANGLIDRILLGGNTSGLDSLKWMEPRAVADVIRYEHPQIQAIVVAYLDPDQAGEVLGHFDHKVRLDIILRVSSLNTVQPAALKELNTILEKQFSGNSNASRPPWALGRRPVDGLDPRDRRHPARPDRRPHVRVQQPLRCRRPWIQALLREVSSDVLVLALKGSDENVKEKIFKNMSKRASELLRDDLEAKGPAPFMSNKDEAPSDLIRARDVGGFDIWSLPSFDPHVPEPEPEPVEEPPAEMEEVPLDEVQPLTLENWKLSARRPTTRASRRVKKMVFAAPLSRSKKPWSSWWQHIARQVIQRELVLDSSHIESVMREALKLLPLGVGNVRLYINPQDFEQVKALRERHEKPGASSRTRRCSPVVVESKPSTAASMPRWKPASARSWPSCWIRPTSRC
ncbi:fliG middle domain-containing protein [Ditylenchus destructor]|nr:fliG middle domain-containing protein [Ditylenchus destructor]